MADLPIPLFKSSAPPAPMSGADVAYTPAAVVSAILTSGAVDPPSLPVWEPCAGGGSWIEALRAARHEVHGTEIDPNAESVRRGLAEQGDAMDGPPAALRGRNFEVWTNPPFSVANELLQAWTRLPTPPRRVVLLMLHAWPNAEERAWIWPYLHRHVLLYPRISFGGPNRDGKGSTDQREYAVLDLRFGPRPATSPTLDRLDWRAGRLSGRRS